MAGNLDPGRDRHMHSASVESVGPDEVRSEWTEHAEGKAASVYAMRLVREAR